MTSGVKCLPLKVLALLIGLMSLSGWADNQSRFLQQYGLGSLECGCYSPNGRHLITGGGGGGVVWDIETGQPIRFFREPGHFVISLAVSPDGTQVLTGGYNGKAVLWEIATGRKIQSFSNNFYGWRDSVFSAAFTPDGTKILTGYDSGSAILWDIESGKRIRIFSEYTGSVYSVAVSPDGTKALTGNSHNTANLWNLSTGEIIRTCRGHSAAVVAVGFSPDGSKLLTASSDSNAKVWDASSGEVVLSLESSSYSLKSAAYSPEGSMILAGSSLGEAILWDAETGQEIHAFSGHEGHVLSVDFSPDSGQLMSLSQCGEAIIWDSASYEKLHLLSGHTAYITSAVFSPDGTRILTGSTANKARLWDIYTGKELCSFSSYMDYVYSFSAVFSPDGNRILTGSIDGRARLWDIASGEEIRTFSGHTKSISSVAFSPDGAFVLTGSQDETIKLWDAATGMELHTFPGHFGGVNSAVFSPDGTKVLTGGDDSAAKLWDIATGNLMQIFVGHMDIIDCVAWSPDGTKVLTGSWDGTAKLWDVETGDEIHTLYGHTDILRSVEFSPDGTTCLTGSYDETARLWDAATGEEIRIFSGHTINVESAGYSPDGKKILTASYDGTTRLWELKPPRVIIVAGGGDYPGNAIADQTGLLGAYACKALKRRGYESGDILYLSAFGPVDPGDSSRPFRDADGDGLNDVDDWASLDSLEQAMTGPFAQNAGRLLILLMDHGHRTNSMMSFRVNETQVVLSTTLDSWLDSLQNDFPVDVTLVVDCCYSGRITEDCGQAPEGRKRIVISSTSNDAVAVFLPPPDLTSFTFSFLSSAYMGNSIGEAWRAGKRFFEEFPVAGQSPQLVDGSTSSLHADREFFGATWAYGVQSMMDVNQFFPAFEVWSASETVSPGDPVHLWIRTLPGQEPEEVVAVIRPPASGVLAGEPVTDLPRILLEQNEDDPRLWEASAADFFQEYGAYTISFSARFDHERVSNPVYTYVTVSEGLNPDATPIRAILAVGGGKDPGLAASLEDLGSYAYSVYLDRFQDDDGYKHPDWIEYYTPFAAPGRDGPADSDRLLSAIDNLPLDTGRLYVHIFGDSRAAGQVQLSSGDVITAAALDSALDDLQSRQFCTVVLIVDAPCSGAFMSSCHATGNQRRVVMTSGRPDDTALFLPGIMPSSFSQKVLAAAYQGHNLDAAFFSGKHFFRAFLHNRIIPQMDDNGDGISNKYDGTLAGELFLGHRFAFAGDDTSELPFMLEVNKTDSPGGAPETFSARLMEGVEPNRVFARLVTKGKTESRRPISSLPEIEFFRHAGKQWRWSGSVDLPPGLRAHTLAVYASYSHSVTREMLSNPGLVRLGENFPDEYEQDDSPGQAGPYYIGSENQQHTLHSASDEDWVYWNAIEGQSYILSVLDPGTDLDAVIEVYDASDTLSPLLIVDSGAGGEGESTEWTALGHGTYFLRVTQSEPVIPTEPGYTLSLEASSGLSPASAEGVSAQAIQLTWLPSDQPDHEVYRSSSIDGLYELVTRLEGIENSFLDDGLSAGTTYYYLIYACDASGNRSQWTRPFGATTEENSACVQWMFY